MNQELRKIFQKIKGKIESLNAEDQQDTDKIDTVIWNELKESKKELEIEAKELLYNKIDKEVRLLRLVNEWVKTEKEISSYENKLKQYKEIIAMGTTEMIDEYEIWISD